MICDTAEQINIRELRANLGDVPPGTSFEQLFFGYRFRVTTTPCPFGGVRFWFVCPDCGRRCEILYTYSCRICCGGRYWSETLDPSNRRIRRALRIRARLGQIPPDLTRRFPDRPVGMHWSTYLRLRKAARERENAMWAEAEVLLRRLRGAKSISSPQRP